MTEERKRIDLIDAVCDGLAKNEDSTTGSGLSKMSLQTIEFLQDECVRLEKELRHEKFISQDRLRTLNEIFSRNFCLQEELKKYENAFYYTTEWLAEESDYPWDRIVEIALEVSTVKERPSFTFHNSFQHAKNDIEGKSEVQ